MEVHQLRYFCAVAESGNFTRAAEAARVAQPSLSQQIHKLEDELGAKLFDRLPRSARLTQFGKAFLPKAQAILRQIGEARVEIREMASVESGEVVLGAIPTVAPYLLPPMLSSFGRRHPSVSVSVVEEITPTLLERLHEGTIDLALLALPIAGDELICDELMQESLFAVLPEKHALAGRRSLLLDDLRAEPFLLLKEGHCFRENALQACRQSRINPKVVFESGQFATILAMVSAGMGVSVVPQMAVGNTPGCRFVKLADKGSQRRIGVARLKYRYPTRAQVALLEHLKKRGMAKAG
ncbi:MAG: LysR family transcriptional regulator [Acidobacteria bacterium]|nr:MAG: LysR family transcriptional regulator [Acidobacteriota bacterium]PYY15444.1 MAG: LysR family transcriptional regulator [Acidobacteriota bacterium]